MVGGVIKSRCSGGGWWWWWLGWSLEGACTIEGYPREREDCLGNDDEGGKQRAHGGGGGGSAGVGSRERLLDVPGERR